MSNKPGQQDYYYWKAKKQGYRSRAAYKLLQIDKKFKIIKKGSIVLDLGASPGGWSQVAAKKAKEVVAVDINPMKGIEGVTFILGDITKRETIEKLKEMGGFDVVICDASPKISGNWDIDHFNSMELAKSAFNVAKDVLKPGGNLVIKMFQGSEVQRVFNSFKHYFKFKKFHSPKASRKRSSEIYFIGKKFISETLEEKA